MVDTRRYNHLQRGYGCVCTAACPVNSNTIIGHKITRGAWLKVWLFVGRPACPIEFVWLFTLAIDSIHLSIKIFSTAFPWHWHVFFSHLSSLWQPLALSEVATKATFFMGANCGTLSYHLRFLLVPLLPIVLLNFHLLH